MSKSASRTRYKLIGGGGEGELAYTGPGCDSVGGGRERERVSIINCRIRLDGVVSPHLLTMPMIAVCCCSSLLRVVAWQPCV